MSTNLNVNNKHSTPSFGAISLVNGAEGVLRKVLKPQEWKEFSEIIKTQQTNSVDVALFGKGIDSEKLYGRVLPNNDSFKIKDYNQGIFESTMGFIRKCCKKADDTKTKIDKLPDVNVDEILKKIK